MSSTSKSLFDQVSMSCSRITTRSYSTSFSLGVLCLDQRLRDAIYSIYGFVRFADEIVDSFHDYNKSELFQRFKKDMHRAIEEKISLNPILNSFQRTVHQYQIEPELYNQFLKSMEQDLVKREYNEDEIKMYILGSAEVVGLMCLRVFCEGDDLLFQKLKPYAQRLGSAFQKINFLRDIRDDFREMGRTYFPGADLSAFDEATKRKIEEDIREDFHEGFKGIKQLPKPARLGVYVAYVYYYALFNKIRNTPSKKILNYRIRIRNRHKFTILAYSYFKHQLNLI